MVILLIVASLEENINCDIRLLELKFVTAFQKKKAKNTFDEDATHKNIQGVYIQLDYLV